MPKLKTSLRTLAPRKVSTLIEKRRRVVEELNQRIATGDDLLVLAFSASYDHISPVSGSTYRTLDGQLVNRADVQTARDMWGRNRKAKRIAREYARSKAVA